MATPTNGHGSAVNGIRETAESTRAYRDNAAASLEHEITNVKESTRLALVAYDNQISEKFKSIDRRFDDGETHRLELKQAADAATLAKQIGDEKALIAALAAAKEAVLLQTTASGLSIAKSEAALTKQQDQNAATFNALVAGMEVAIDDLKASVLRIQGARQGSSETKSNIVAIASAVSAVIGATVGALIALA